MVKWFIQSNILCRLPLADGQEGLERVGNVERALPGPVTSSRSLQNDYKRLVDGIVRKLKRLEMLEGVKGLEMQIQSSILCRLALVLVARLNNIDSINVNKR